MLHDLKHAYRMLMQSKGWTLVVLLSLAIGIGATTALFTAVNGLLLQTVAVRDPKRAGRSSNGPARTTWSARSSDYGFSQPHNGEQRAQHVLVRDLSAAQGRQPDDDRPDRGHVARVVQFRVEWQRRRSRRRSACRATTSRCSACRRSSAARSKNPTSSPAPSRWRCSAMRSGSGDSAATASIVGKTVRLNNTAGDDRRRAAAVVHRHSADGGHAARCDRAVRDRAAVGDAAIARPRLRPRRSRASNEPTNWYIQIAGRLKPGVTLEQVKGNLAGPFQQAARAGMDGFMAGLTDAERKLSRNQREGDGRAGTAGAARRPRHLRPRYAPRRDRRRCSA